MTMLVTGATGFVGTNVVREAAAAGHRVRAAGHRRTSPHLDGLGVDVVSGDITQPDQADALVRGCDVVLHVAGDATSYWRRLAARQHRINVDGTMNIARACVHHEVSRLVYTSTIDVLGHDPSRAEITEDTGFFNFTNMGYFYGESKFEAEYRLRRFADQHDLDLVIIYPGMMLGPYSGTNQWGGLLLALRDGSLPGAPCGGSSFCHVTEVARAHLAAVDKGQRGHGYISAGHNMPYRDCLNLMADAIGAAHPRVALPEWAYVALGRAEETACRGHRAATLGGPGHGALPEQVPVRRLGQGHRPPWVRDPRRRPDPHRHRRLVPQPGPPPVGLATARAASRAPRGRHDPRGKSRSCRPRPVRCRPSPVVCSGRSGWN